MNDTETNDQTNDQLEQHLRELRAKYHAALDELQAAVRAQCSFEHRLTQHRDAKPPWCNICGRDELGYPRRKLE